MDHGWYLMFHSSTTCIIGIKFCDDYDCHLQLNEDTYLELTIRFPDPQNICLEINIVILFH